MNKTIDFVESIVFLGQNSEEISKKNLCPSGGCFKIE
jgi:hypothetical protein